MHPQIKKIIEAGSAAPSGENCQPWRFRIEGKEILLYNLPERDTSIYNFLQKGSLLSCGAVIENMVVAATVEGYSLDVELFPEGENTNLVARIKLRQVEINPDPLNEVINKRCTNRKPYKSEPLSENDVQKLIHSTEIFKLEGVQTKFINSQDKIKTLAPALTLNERLIFSNSYLHNFFFSHLRWTEEEDRKKRNGFFVKALELKLPQVVAFKLFKHWSVIKFLDKFGFASVAGRANLKNYQSSAAIGIIKVNNNTSKDYVLAGRAMERLWLEATNLGLSLQPVTGTIFFMQKVFAGKTEEFTQEQVEMIKNSYKQIASAFLHKEGTIAMLFRVGRSEPPTARSSRFEVQSFIEK